MQQIPLQPIPAQRLQVVLDGQNCTLAVYTRGRSLYADLDVGSNTVFRGAICRYGADVVQSPTLLFSGSLHFYDTQGGMQDPEYTGLGSRYILLYLSAGETVPAALQF